MSLGRRSLSLALAICVAVTGLSAIEVVASSTQASALSGGQFDPANIISDSNFYNANAMSAAEIQAFLDRNVSSCNNSNCLKTLAVPTSSRAKDAMCNGYRGASSESSATIIFKVQQACSVSAKVLLVILQKEQGLITSREPSSLTIERAMGFACPDTANGGCDPTFAGLYNQLYRAAWQLKRYGNPAGASNYFTWFPVGSPSQVRYSPNIDCGGSSVTIQNKATAALYYYTPYQPNPAALGNLGGVGDSCSAYGNRNFWAYYTNWFGSPTLPPGSPDGAVEAITATSGQINISGWVVDRDVLTASVVIAVQIDSQWAQTTANQPHPSVADNYPGAGANHGFTASFPASPGDHTICLYAQNQRAGVDLGLGCSAIHVPDGSPIGLFSAAEGGANSVTVSGWAIDTDQPDSPVILDVQVGSLWFTASANQPYPLGATLYPGAGANHGFSNTFAVPEGQSTVCIYTRNQGRGTASALGCNVVTVVSATPLGALTSVTSGEGTISLSGWTVDPDTAIAPLILDVQIDSAWRVWTANLPNDAAAAAVSGAGPNHGFSGTVLVPAGQHTACVYVRNSGSGAPLGLGCKTLVVASTPSGGATPVGNFTSASGVPGGVNLRGWALDTDLMSKALVISVQLDSQWSVLVADQPSAEAQAAVSVAGPNHGFSGIAPGSVGNHTVCLYAIGVGGGADLALGCRVVTVPAAVGVIPQGKLATLSSAPLSIHVSGWAADADAPAQALAIDVQVDSKWTLLKADKPSGDSASGVAGAGSNHGFTGLISTTAGRHTVCIYVKSQGGGPDLGFGCQVVNVPGAVAAVAPAAGLEGIVAGAGTINFAGWALDPQFATEVLSVDVQIGPTWLALPANLTNNASNAAYPNAGSSHGFGGSVPVPIGRHTVCLYVSNFSKDAAISMGCQSLTVTAAADPSPVGGVISVKPSSGSVSISGWAVDVDSLDTPVEIDVQAGASWSTIKANSPYSSGSLLVPGAGSAHGFMTTITAPPGQLTICFYPRNVGLGNQTSLGCRQVSVPR